LGPVFLRCSARFTARYVKGEKQNLSNRNRNRNRNRNVKINNKATFRRLPDQ
jgi:hypothetical protein